MNTPAQIILGIDIGGTGVKGAPVNIKTGEMTAERFRVETPQPATPEAVAAAANEIVEHFKWKGPIGCTLPAVVKRGVVMTAANIDPSWIGTDGEKLFTRKLKNPVLLMNDADAAGIAEMAFGAGRSEDGLVIVVTLGTGIGTAIFNQRILVANSELGHLEIKGKDAECIASNRVREVKELSWKKWSKNVTRYLSKLESLLWPDLFIIGGGVSKKGEKFIPRLDVRAPVIAAELLNDAGIVGAAMAAHDRYVGKAPMIKDLAGKSGMSQATQSH